MPLNTLAQALERAERREARTDFCAVCPARHHMRAAISACRGSRLVPAAFHALQALGIGAHQDCGLPAAIHDPVITLVAGCRDRGAVIPTTDPDQAACPTTP